jgi:hypothetical protein
MSEASVLSDYKLRALLRQPHAEGLLYYYVRQSSMSVSKITPRAGTSAKAILVRPWRKLSR